MTIDLEDELRHAMQDHVGTLVARRTLAQDVKRRHRRRVRRRRAILSGVSVIAIVAAAVPILHALNETHPAAALDRTSHRTAKPAVPTSAPPSTVRPPEPSPTTHPPSPAPSTPARTPTEPSPSPNGRGMGMKVTYMPPGLQPSGPCGASSYTYSCTWSDDSWNSVVVEAALVPASDTLANHACHSLPFFDFFMPPQRGSVHGHTALITDCWDGGRRVSWIERQGAIVSVTVSGLLHAQLLTIAESVRLSQ